MSNDIKRLTQDDLKTFLFCIIVIFLVLVLPRINSTNFYTQLNHLISFNSDFYNYENPPIFFSIGEALSALAILFAVYQFNNDRWRLPLRIRNYVMPTVLYTFALGFVLAVYSSLVTFRNPTNIFQLSVFWQIASSLCIAFSIFFLFNRTPSKNLFNKKNYKRFYNVLSQEISRPDTKRIDLVLNVLLDSFDNICKSIAENNSEMSNYARSTLEVILSDRSMINHITTKRLDGLLYILAVIKKYNLNANDSPKGIPLMIQGLFYNSDSFLYKHLDNSGLALSSNIYESLFDSPSLLSNFDIFGYPTLGFSARGNTDSGTVKVFIESISRSIKTYLKTGKVPARHINNGIAYLSSIFEELCSKIAIEQKSGKNTRWDLDGNWWSLHEIAYFLGHDYLFIGHKRRFDGIDDVVDKNIEKMEKAAKKADFYSNLAINEGIAEILYKSFEHLSRVEKDNDTYNTVLDLLNGMTHESSHKEGYREPFEKRMWIQIGRNVLGKYYPMVLKSYLQFVGFSLVGGEGQRTGWIGEQSEKMRKLLYIDLKPKLDANEKMIDDTPMKEALLPDCMDYKDGKFTYTMGFGRGPTEVILPPPVGSESALKDINWKDSVSSV